MARVFVSHSHHNNDFCRKFVASLRQLGVETWYDENDLGAGSVSRVIQEEIQQCEYFIVILSQQSVQAFWVIDEINAARALIRSGKMKAILPVLAEPCTVPLFLDDYRRIEGVSSPEDAARLAHNLLFVQGHSTTSDNLQVKVVTSPDDPDLDQFFALYNTLFPLADERASTEDMIRYISESQIELAKPDPDYLEQLVLVKVREQVVAFLNYTFYFQSRYVLISYIGNVSGESSRAAVIGALLAHFKQVMLENGCLGVVFEVETKRNKGRGEIARIRLFRGYLKQYANLADSNCYEIDFNFIQPFLLVEDVKDEPNRFAQMMSRMFSSSGSVQDLGVVNLLSLGFIPLVPNLIQGNVMSKEQLMSILRFVYQEVYGDSFIDNPQDDAKYKAYMKRLLKYYEHTLPNSIPLRVG